MAEWAFLVLRKVVYAVLTVHVTEICYLREIKFEQTKLRYNPFLFTLSSYFLFFAVLCIYFLPTLFFHPHQLHPRNFPPLHLLSSPATSP